MLAELIAELELDPDPSKPLLVKIYRLDYQKGVDLVPEVLRMIKNLAWQTVILNPSDPKIEDGTRRLERELTQVRAKLRYDDGLARRI